MFTCTSVKSLQSQPGYCDRCEVHTTIRKEHICSVCYQSFCEKCYYDEVYGDDLCNSCFYDMERSVKRSIKQSITKIALDVKKIQKDQKTIKHTQNLLIALKTISLHVNLSKNDVKIAKNMIKELLYKKQTSVVDNNEFLIDIIEDLSGLKLNRTYDSEFNVNVTL